MCQATHPLGARGWPWPQRQLQCRKHNLSAWRCAARIADDAQPYDKGCICQDTLPCMHCLFTSAYCKQISYFCSPEAARPTSKIAARCQRAILLVVLGKARRECSGCLSLLDAAFTRLFMHKAYASSNAFQPSMGFYRRSILRNLGRGKKATVKLLQPSRVRGLRNWPTPYSFHQNC